MGTGVIIIDELNSLKEGRVYSAVDSETGLQLEIQTSGSRFIVAMDIKYTESATFSVYEVRLALGENYNYSYTELKIQVCSIDMIEKRLMVKLNSDGSGSLVYDGSRREIFSERAASFGTNVILGTFDGVFRVSNSLFNERGIAYLSRYGDWESVDVIVGCDYVLLDVSEKFYIRLNMSRNTRLEVVKGYVLKQLTNYFIVTMEIDEYLFIKSCYSRDSVLDSVLSEKASIVNKRLL